jgi:hypothetical protein
MELRVTHKVNVLYHLNVRNSHVGGICFENRLGTSCPQLLSDLPKFEASAGIILYRGPEPVLISPGFITGDSRYMRFRYPLFRISVVLFQYHEHQYPIRGCGRSCRADPLSCANYRLHLSENWY